MLVKRIIAIAFFPCIISMFPACKKSDNNKNAAPSPNYTAKMGGVRNWHGTYYSNVDPYHHHANYTPTFYTFPDTSFALGIVNDATVIFMGETYVYSGTDTANSFYAFGDSYLAFGQKAGTGIMYYYRKNTIEYYKGMYWTGQTHYYTY